MTQQDVMRFRNRTLDLFGGDELRRDALFDEVVSNVDMQYLFDNEIVLEAQVSEALIEAAGGTFGDSIFVYYWRRENGGRISLFDPNSPPTWDGGTFVPDFVYSGIVYNGFLFSKSNY